MQTTGWDFWEDSGRDKWVMTSGQSWASIGAAVPKGRGLAGIYGVAMPQARLGSLLQMPACTSVSGATLHVNAYLPCTWLIGGEHRQQVACTVALSIMLTGPVVPGSYNPARAKLLTPAVITLQRHMRGHLARRRCCPADAQHTKSNAQLDCLTLSPWQHHVP